MLSQIYALYFVKYGALEQGCLISSHGVSTVKLEQKIVEGHDGMEKLWFLGTNLS